MVYIKIIVVWPNLIHKNEDIAQIITYFSKCDHGYTSKILNNVKKHLHQFMWGNKKVRIPISKLQQNTRQGKIALPNTLYC